MKTHAICEGCGKDTAKWYEMPTEGNYCIMCFIKFFPELVDESDIENEEGEAQMLEQLERDEESRFWDTEEERDGR